MDQQSYILNYAIPYIDMVYNGEDSKSLEMQNLKSNWLDNPDQYTDSLLIAATKEDAINPSKFNVEGFTFENSGNIIDKNQNVDFL